MIKIFIQFRELLDCNPDSIPNYRQLLRKNAIFTRRYWYQRKSIQFYSLESSRCWNFRAPNVVWYGTWIALINSIESILLKNVLSINSMTILIVWRYSHWLYIELEEQKQYSFDVYMRVGRIFRKIKLLDPWYNRINYIWTVNSLSKDRHIFF